METFTKLLAAGLFLYSIASTASSSTGTSAACRAPSRWSGFSARCSASRW
jgi:hypothetical protein